MKKFDLPIKSFPAPIPVVSSGKKQSQTGWAGKHVLCGFHTELNFSFFRVSSHCLLELPLCNIAPVSQDIFFKLTAFHIAVQIPYFHYAPSLIFM